MWKQLWEIAKKIGFLAQDTQKNKSDIKTLQDQMEELTETVRQMAYDIRRDRENEAQEREKLLLRLEIALLRSERRNLTGRSEPGFLLEETDNPLPPEA